ncbi:hypothetical protein AURDEDRAFT_158328 [Auricularia subglabra TFB-10046 SS5]|nr:hypothetical protein AURDEDRAFT_158328 [Auricularia subglabra TFB-10046 SS5]
MAVASDPLRAMERMPGELWARIFQLGSDDDWLLPVYASAVCKVWRTAARHHPAVWSRIVTRVGFGRPIHYEYQLARLFLSRSRSAPLRIRLDLSRATDPQAVVFLRLFSNQLARCAVFTFTGRVSHAVIGHCFKDLWGETSRLEELDMTLTGFSQGFAPELALVGNPCAWTGALPAKMYERVRRCKVDFPDATSMPPDAFLSIFHSYPNLEALDVRIGHGVSLAMPQWDFSPPLRPMPAPVRLKELHLEGVSISDLTSILDFKKLALTSLSVHAVGTRARYPSVGPTTLPIPIALCNPSSTLQTLELGGYALSGCAFLPLLRMIRGLPSLTRLALSHVRLDAQLFQALSYSMPGMRAWALPKLTQLELHQISLGMAHHRQWAWALDVARRRNVVAKCGGPVARLTDLKCDIVSRDGRVLMDLREVALSGPIGIRVSSTGYGITFFI